VFVEFHCHVSCIDRAFEVLHWQAGCHQAVVCLNSAGHCLRWAGCNCPCTALLARCMARQRWSPVGSCCADQCAGLSPQVRMQREAIAAKKARTGLAKDDEWEGDSFVKQSESMVAN